jgi:hypothetical protein
VEDATGIQFAKKNEPGDLGTTGRYRGTAIPYGSATLQPSEDLVSKSPQEALKWLLNSVKVNLETFRRSGASDVTIDLVVFHDGQCNLEFSVHELREIAELGLSLTLSTYEAPEVVEKAFNGRVSKDLQEVNP